MNQLQLGDTLLLPDQPTAGTVLDQQLFPACDLAPVAFIV